MFLLVFLPPSFKLCILHWGVAGYQCGPCSEGTPVLLCLSAQNGACHAADTKLWKQIGVYVLVGIIKPGKPGGCSPLRCVRPSVVSDPWRPHGLQPTRLLCPWRFFRQKSWSGQPCPPPGDVPHLGTEPRPPSSQAGSLSFELTWKNLQRISSVQFSRSVVSDSLWPHEPQHARPPCPSPTPGAYSNPCPSGRWCHPAISPSVVPFSSAPDPSQHQVLSNASLFACGGHSTGVPASERHHYCVLLLPTFHHLGKLWSNWGLRETKTVIYKPGRPEKRENSISLKTAIKPNTYGPPLH